MSITYTYDNAEGTTILAVDDSAASPSLKYIPVDPGNRDYAKLLASGADIGEYTPPELTPLTAEEKLANAGLTVEELQTLLGL